MKKPLLDPQVKALLQVGYFKLIDLIFLLSWVAVFATAIFFWCKGSWTVERFLLCTFIQGSITGIWGIILLYRNLYQVIMARSDVNMMPDAAAKLALTYTLKK